MKKMPLVAAVHDLSGYGRCSLTVAIPILSVMGIQCCPLPTAILSNHTAFESFYFTDYTEHMRPYYQEWKKRGLEFDSIYTGFLGSVKQVDIVIEFVKEFRNGAKVVVDPVMGDHGEIYKTYTPEMVRKMECLVSKADIITPNLTEASILLGKKYSGETVSIEQLKEYLTELCCLGPDTSLITGITTDEGEHINACFDKSKNQYWKVPFEYVGIRYPGTGDLFTALFTGYLLNGKLLPEAMEDASIFVSKTVHATYEARTPGSEGVLFEKVMKELYTEHINYRYSKI